MRRKQKRETPPEATRNRPGDRVLPPANPPPKMAKGRKKPVHPERR
jgi:hypothetical protein